MAHSVLEHTLVEDALLEREAELSILDSLLEAALDGRGSQLVIEGPPGIGKSSLVQEARAQAEASGMEILAARGSEPELDFPFGVVRQLFEPHLAVCSDQERDELLSGAARFAQPALSDRLLGADGDDADASYATLHGLYWLAASLAARGPLLIAVDDADWSDAASLHWLAYLSKRVEDLSALVVLTASPAEPETHRELVDELISDPMAQVLRPAPLSEPAAAQLIRASLFSDAQDEFCIACHEVTQGNPFLLRELVSELHSEGIAPTTDNAAQVRGLGPRAVSRFVLRRLARLPHAATPLAHAVSIVGDGAELRQAAALAGLDNEAAAEAAHLLREMGILRGEAELGFAHPIVRAAIYSDLALPERLRGHARAARLLHAEGAAPAQVASHLLAAGCAGDPWVVERLRDAARTEIARGAREEAVSYLRRALAEPPAPGPRAETLLELGRAEVHTGGSEGVEHLREALELTEDPVDRAQVALELGRGLSMLADWPEAVAVLDRAISELDSRDRDLAMRLEAELIAVAIADRRTSGMARERLAKIREGVGDERPVNPTLLTALALLAVMEGESREKASSLARRALEAQAPFSEDNSQTLALLGNVLVWTDQLEIAARIWDEALAVARRRGSVPLFATASCFRSQIAYRSGALREAEADARAALDALDAAAWGVPAPIYPLAFLIETLVERGDLSGAEQTLERAAVEDDLPELAQFNRFLFSRAGLRFAQGATQEAVEDLLECGRRLEAFGMHNPTAIPWRSSAGLGLLSLDEPERARRLVAEELTLARRFGAPRALGIALRAAGLVEGGNAGIEHLREAVGVLEGSPCSLDLARALVDLGAALRRAGQRLQARDPLRDGLDLAVRCGATPLADRAHEELLATGARPRRAERTGVRALTASEYRVGGMAMEGLTNREIAEALFVTEKTIEMHLSNAYQKLGIRSRSELAKALSEE